MTISEAGPKGQILPILLRARQFSVLKLPELPKREKSLSVEILLDYKINCTEALVRFPDFNHHFSLFESGENVFSTDYKTFFLLFFSDGSHCPHDLFNYLKA